MSQFIKPNQEWNIRQNVGGSADCEHIMTATLLDIRRELQNLNRLLNCRNFLRIPSDLAAIKTSTGRIRRPRPKVKK